MRGVPIAADTVFGFGCTMVLVGIMVQSTTGRPVRADTPVSPPRASSAPLIRTNQKNPLGRIPLHAGDLTIAREALAASPTVTPADVVSSLEGTFGVHPGRRRNHIKGTCASGEFVGTPEAAAVSRSKQFSGQPIPTIVRFSVAGGNPNVADTATNARGMALEFELPGGSKQHMTMLKLRTNSDHRSRCEDQRRDDHAEHFCLPLR
jgi:hypothetical protein